MQKRINTQADMAAFSRSKARSKLYGLIEYTSKLVMGLETPSAVANPDAQGVLNVFHSLHKTLEQVPPITAKQRFGNVAFRDWHAHAEPIFAAYDGELAEYLSLSWGNPQRLDYGTGHELNFLAFLGGIMESFSGQDLLKVWDEYYKLSREIILQYKLEPAGSHGVWGLDDHYHLCYVFGAAQLLTDSNAPTPKDILVPLKVKEWSPINLYFSGINFINTVKRGPFHEHSPLLFDASAAANWTKIKNGMTRMYVDNVFDKFPVVQHFLFGSQYEFSSN